MSKTLRAGALAAAAFLAGCQNVLLRPTDPSYDPSSGPPTWRTGDLEVTTERRPLDGPFPVGCTLTNLGDGPIRVAVRLAAVDAPSGVIGDRFAPDGVRFPLVAGEAFDVPSHRAQVVLHLLPDRPWTRERPAQTGDTASYSFEGVSGNCSGGDVRLVVVHDMSIGAGVGMAALGTAAAIVIVRDVGDVARAFRW